MKTSNTEQTQLVSLKEEEIREIYGGSRIGRMLFTAGLFMACPALGVFHLGVRAGYREEAGN